MKPAILHIHPPLTGKSPDVFQDLMEEVCGTISYDPDPGDYIVCAHEVVTLNGTYTPVVTRFEPVMPFTIKFSMHQHCTPSMFFAKMASEVDQLVSRDLDGYVCKRLIHYVDNNHKQRDCYMMVLNKPSIDGAVKITVIKSRGSQKHRCTCDKYVVIHQGCKCGGI